jgi:regulator of RNase E activity RraA
MSEQLEREYLEYKEGGRIWGTIDKDRIKKINFPRTPKHIIDEFLKIEDPTSTVSDILDKLGIRGAVAGTYLRPVIPGKTIVGNAVTIRNIYERQTVTKCHVNGETHKMTVRDIYYLGEPGDVYVMDFGGNLDVSNLGDQACALAQSKGFAGCIVNGAVRDIAGIRRLGYPVWSRGITPITGMFRLEGMELNGPVTLYDITVCPGDLIVADDTGVCAIPPDKIDYVLEEVKKVIAKEVVVRQQVQEQKSIEELKKLNIRD